MHDVRPILSRACFQCHGPDAAKRQGDVRLDVAESAKAVHDGKAAIVPKDPAKSEALRRIRTNEPDERMPPVDSGKTLSAAEIETITRWIREGAVYQAHWAFSPPVRPAVPKVKHAEWARNPIDLFVLARLEQEGLMPAPPADRVTLLRRLWLDLVGLPPPIREVDAFTADASTDAIRNAVDRLLASPHYGEKWGRHWLDAARYADSDGYEKDKSRRVWFYRDWVVRALNRDLPYDQFLTQQLAGDLLPGATQEELVATGFLRNSMVNEEGGIDPEQFRMEAIFDRMDALGKGVLGLTIQCAQCHSHKFDPLSMEEYYRLFAFLNNAHEANIAVYTPAEEKQRASVLARIRTIEDQMRTARPKWRQYLSAWEEWVRDDQPRWTILRPEVDDISTGGQKYLPMPDGSFLCQGYAPTKHRGRLAAKITVPRVTGVRLELLTDPNLPLGGPGRAPNGTCALTEFEVFAVKPGEPKKEVPVPIALATADVEPASAPLEAIFDDKSHRKRVTGPVAYALDRDDTTAWGIDLGPGRRNVPRKAVFRFAQPLESAAGTTLVIYLTQNHGGWNSDDNRSNNLGRFRLSFTVDAEPAADPLPAPVREILSVPPQGRTAEEAATLFSYWRTTVFEWREPNLAIERAWKDYPEGTAQLVLAERRERRKTYLLERGDFLKPASLVEPATPSWLNPWPAGAPANRLGLARWITDPKAPTTARAFVNRVWQAYFGQGLVTTSEDLGSQCQPPSHPELLDWLAVTFVESGWSIKGLHRLITDSATYQQSSRIRPEAFARDPQNRLLARGPRQRVEAEIVRDIALSISGRLCSNIGGPSVYPPAPDFLFVPPASYGPKLWPEAKQADRYRRGLYTFRYRSVPYPVLQTLDAPNGDIACVRRVRSNTPLQSLTLLNEPLFVECAQGLAERILREGGSTVPARLKYAFRRCLARPPAPDEAAVLLHLYQSQLDRYLTEKKDPWELATSGTRPVLPKYATPSELAAWTAVSRVLLNLDETITKE